MPIRATERGVSACLPAATLTRAAGADPENDPARRYDRDRRAPSTLAQACQKWWCRSWSMVAGSARSSKKGRSSRWHPVARYAVSKRWPLLTVAVDPGVRPGHSVLHTSVLGRQRGSRLTPAKRCLTGRELRRRPRRSMRIYMRYSLYKDIRIWRIYYITHLLNAWISN